MESLQPRDGAGRWASKGYCDVSTDLLEDLNQVSAMSRAKAADLGESEARALAEPSVPLEVRLVLASRPERTCAERAARDPNPLVRSRALDSAVLSASSRTRLESDPQVRATRALLGKPATFSPHVSS